MNNMSFKSFIEQSEFEVEFKILSEAIMMDEASFGDIAFGLAAPFKALGGAATNIIGQTAKGATNVGIGAGKTAAGLGRAAIGGLQLLGGGKQGFANVGKGLATAASGAGTALKGATQLGAMPLTATVRGIQAAGEDTSQTGQFFMGDKKRNWLQKTFGLNRWDKQRQPETEQPQVSVPTFADLQKSYQTVTQSGDKKAAQNILAKMQQNYPDEYKAAFAKPSPETAGVPTFQGYAKALNQAIKSGDMNKAKMLTRHLKQYYPKEYDAAVQRAKAKAAAPAVA